MPGTLQITKNGPRTCVPAEAIIGGQLVEGRASGRIGVAAAGSTRVLGVALTDALPPETDQTTPTVANGRPLLTAVVLPTLVAVAYGDNEVPVTYSAAANFGDPLVATGSGKVGPAGATPDARTIIGRCTEPAGVTTANTVALARIF